MNTGELVRCAGITCKSEDFVRLTGTVPKKWLSVWIESQRKSFRCCSDPCVKTVKEAYRGENTVY